MGEKSTGFNWHNKEWNFARFKPEKYLVEKIKTKGHKILCYAGVKQKKRHDMRPRTER